MNRKFIILIVLGLAGFIGGCKEDKTDSGGYGTSGGQAAKPDVHADKDDAGVHAGPKHDLGKQEVAGYTVSVKQVGAVKAGAGATFEITLTGGAGKPKAVRAWVGTEAGDGSVKVKAEDRGEFFDADLEVPATLAPQSKLWVEIETDAGKKTTSFNVKL